MTLAPRLWPTRARREGAKGLAVRIGERVGQVVHIIRGSAANFKAVGGLLRAGGATGGVAEDVRVQGGREVGGKGRGKGVAVV